MPTLKDLLDDIEIETDDLEDKNEINLKDVKLEDLDEKSRPIVEKAMGLVNDLTNEVSKVKLVNETLRSVQPEPIVKPKEEEEEETDPVQIKLNSLESEIATLKSGNAADEQAQFESNLKDFASKNKDIVRYAKDMDAILKEHPTLTKDIPSLYKLAKSTAERREKLRATKKAELSATPKRSTTESSGMSGANVDPLTQGKTIGEAFGHAEEQLNRR